MGRDVAVGLERDADGFARSGVPEYVDRGVLACPYTGQRTPVGPVLVGVFGVRSLVDPPAVVVPCPEEGHSVRMGLDDGRPGFAGVLEVLADRQVRDVARIELCTGPSRSEHLAHKRGEWDYSQVELRVAQSQAVVGVRTGFGGGGGDCGAQALDVAGLQVVVDDAPERVGIVGEVLELGSQQRPVPRDQPEVAGCVYARDPVHLNASGV